eukprot:14037154-Alexandrium_andersonii.AAC.1
MLPFQVEAETEAELLPPLESARPTKAEFEGCTKVQVAIDSGAAASAMPERLLTGHAVVPGEACQNGACYLAADGGRIPNLGEVDLGFFTKDRFNTG